MIRRSSISQAARDEEDERSLRDDPHFEEAQDEGPPPGVTDVLLPARWVTEEALGADGRARKRGG